MKRFLSAIALSLFAILLISESVQSAPRKSGALSSLTALILDNDTRLDINNLEMFVYNDGNIAYDNANILGKTDGLYFPRGTTKTVVYSAGIWVGAMVNGEIRLAIAEYSSEFAHGPMENGIFVPDNSDFRVYKIGTGDTPVSNPDYANWPIDQGAPVDENGDPLLIGNQMMWSVFNDADSNRHINDAASTQPLGLKFNRQHLAMRAAERSVTPLSSSTNSSTRAGTTLRTHMCRSGRMRIWAMPAMTWLDATQSYPWGTVTTRATMRSMAECHRLLVSTFSRVPSFPASPTTPLSQMERGATDSEICP